MTQDEVVAVSNGAADTAGIPRLLLLACGVAEGSLNPNARRPSVAANDQAYWPDVSFGSWQQTVRWATEYSGGGAYPGEAEIERVGAFYLIPAYAAAVAAKQLKGHYHADEDDATFKALCRYNWPAGDGAPKSGAVATNYRNGIAEATTILGDSPMPPPVVSVTFQDYRDPQPSGTFSGTPNGVILHGSRSGVAGNPKASEYTGTANYEVNNTADLGWNATIGENIVAVHLTPKEWGWNARNSSQKHLAVEFAQATVDEPLTDAQVDAFVAWLKERVLTVYPDLPLAFPTHAELDGTAEYGTYDGKSDAFPKGDARTDDLRARIMARLGATPMPTPSAHVVGPGVLARMAQTNDTPATDELYVKNAAGADQYSETYGRSGTRYVYLFDTNIVYSYPPAA